MQFKASVAHEVSLLGNKLGDARLEILVALHAPDKRIRDIDNVLKPLLDALVQAKLFNDDSQVDMLTVIRKEYIAGGQCQVVVRSY
jgi:Holliday junction resolvase RusA-like endonuclease